MYLKHCSQLASRNYSCTMLLVRSYLETGRKLLLLLVNYAEAEVNFVGLLEVRLHAHHLRKGFLGVF